MGEGDCLHGVILRVRFVVVFLTLVLKLGENPRMKKVSDDFLAALRSGSAEEVARAAIEWRAVLAVRMRGMGLDLPLRAVPVYLQRRLPAVRRPGRGTGGK